MVLCARLVRVTLISTRLFLWVLGLGFGVLVLVLCCVLDWTGLDWTGDVGDFSMVEVCIFIFVFILPDFFPPCFSYCRFPMPVFLFPVSQFFHFILLPVSLSPSGVSSSSCQVIWYSIHIIPFDTSWLKWIAVIKETKWNRKDKGYHSTPCYAMLCHNHSYSHPERASHCICFQVDRYAGDGDSFFFWGFEGWLREQKLLSLAVVVCGLRGGLGLNFVEVEVGRRMVWGERGRLHLYR